MESLTKPVTLTQDVAKVLDEIRAGADNALYGAGPDVSEELFAKHVVSLVEGAGLPVLQTMHYRWFLRELARLWRTRTGRDLAFHLELCIRKWVGLGLEPKTLQFLVCESYERLKGKQSAQPQSSQSTPSQGGELELTTKTPSHEENLGSDTGILESSNPGTLPGDPSIPSASTTKTPSHQAGTTMNDERGTMNERPKDARAEPDSTAKSQRHEEEGTTAKDAKTAKSGSDSATGIPESSTPGVLP